MAEITDVGRGSDPGSQRAMVSAAEVSEWFVRDVLPLEAILMHFLQHNWHNQSDIADLRQEVYVRLFEAAQHQIPDHTKRFVLTTARNLLIDRVRRDQVVPIEAIADVDVLSVAAEVPLADRTVMAREELRRLQEGLDRLPPRCREAVVYAHVDGLSGQQIAQRMGISEAAVSKHLARGLFQLTDILYGETAERRSKQ